MPPIPKGMEVLLEFTISWWIEVTDLVNWYTQCHQQLPLGDGWHHPLGDDLGDGWWSWVYSLPFLFCKIVEKVRDSINISLEVGFIHTNHILVHWGPLCKCPSRGNLRHADWVHSGAKTYLTHRPTAKVKPQRYRLFVQRHKTLIECVVSAQKAP